jgi:hypothetical protein
LRHGSGSKIATIQRIPHPAPASSVTPDGGKARTSKLIKNIPGKKPKYTIRADLALRNIPTKSIQ